MNRFYRLLAFGFLPKEIPPSFYSGELARAVKSNLAAFQATVPAGKNDWSRPTIYLLRQKSNYRRALSIVNPVAYVPLADRIANGYHNFAPALASNLSVSSPRFYRKTKYFRAVGAKETGAAVKKARIKVRSQYSMLLRFDVKNFYKSIYTHSIPWALHGKKVCKANLRLPPNQRQSLFGDILDASVRDGQDGQTMGVPVGPDTSFLIGEAVLSYVDRCLRLPADKGFRFYDDYEIGCQSHVEAEQILARVEVALRDLELELNPDKVKIVQCHSLGDDWPLAIRNYTRSTLIRSDDDLMDLYNFVAHTAGRFPEGSVFKYFIKRMRNTVVPPSMWSLWQNILFSAGLSERGAAREIFEQLDLYQKIGYTIDRRRLKGFLDAKVQQELRPLVDSELSWTLFGYERFDIRPERDSLREVITQGDDISRLLAIRIALRRGFSVLRPLRRIFEDSFEPRLFRRSSHWLLMWELYQNEWITDARLQNEVNSDSFFTLLDQYNVSFLRDASTDLFEIPRAFRDKIEAEELAVLQQEIAETFAFDPQGLDVGDEPEADEEDSDEDDDDDDDDDGGY